MMFRAMRRANQQLSPAETAAILQNGTSGVLALMGDEGYPYALPISYVYFDGALYFHCAREGHKLDAIRRSPKASFCVIAQDDILPEQYATCYRSAIAFGAVRVMEEEKEIYAAVQKLALKYAPDDAEDRREQYIQKNRPRLCMLKMTIEHMTGKEAKELARRRAQNG